MTWCSPLLVMTLCARTYALTSQSKRGSRGLLSGGHIPLHMPQDILEYYDHAKAQEFRKALAAGAAQGAQPVQKFDYERCHRSDTVAKGKQCLNSGKESVFEAANVSFQLPKKYFLQGQAGSNSPKHVVQMKPSLSAGVPSGVPCVVYGVGLASDSKFEDAMAGSGCEVHAFDCTVKPGMHEGKKFTFHRWCIGRKGEADYSNSTYTDGKDLLFKTLDQTKRELGHPKIDLLKIDIEGFEYEVIENEILDTKSLPLQIAVELHTEEASNRFVPETNSKGKGFNEVNRLFLKLFDNGYRIISKEVNPWDKACAEYVLLNVDMLQGLE